MTPFITKDLLKSLFAVREGFDEKMPLTQLGDLGWELDEDGWLVLSITDTVSIQANREDGSISMEVWVDDWMFGRITGLKVYSCNGRSVVCFCIEDGSNLVYSVEDEPMEASS